MPSSEMSASEALAVLKIKPAPKVEIDLAFIEVFNASMVQKTLSWSKDISFPLIDNKGLRQGLEDFCQLKEVPSQDAISTAPLSWGFTFIETQVTRGIAFFLDVDTQHRQARIESFLEACGVTAPNNVSDYYVASEHCVASENGFKGGRFDVMIAWGQNGEKYNQGLVCEFKLGSEIGPEQLRNYEKAAETEILETRNFAFISERYKKSDLEALKTTSKTWTTRLWWKFLRDWESRITYEIDDQDFRQFRATLWNQLA